jgi:hypothetical protein
MSPPRADPSREWKKSKVKTEDLFALLNSEFIREKEVDMWRAAAGDPYPMEKAEQYLAYKLIDSNADWKARWFYITNHHPGLPKPSGRQPRHRD